MHWASLPNAILLLIHLDKTLLGTKSTVYAGNLSPDGDNPYVLEGLGMWESAIRDSVQSSSKKSDGGGAPADDLVASVKVVAIS